MDRVLHKDGVELSADQLKAGIKPDTISYGVNDKLFHLKELTWGQHTTAREELFDDLNKAADNPEWEGNNFKMVLTGDKIEFLIGLSTGLDASFIKEMNASDVQQIVNDFFFLNPQLKKDLVSTLTGTALKKATTDISSFWSTVGSIRRRLLKEKTPPVN